MIEKKDNFNFIRLCLALSILFVHAAGISNSNELSFIFKYLNGDIVVKCFFVISGYLVALSFRRSDVTEFFIKRARRILPGYFMVVAIMLFLGFLLTRLTKMDFILNQGTWSYFLFNSIFLGFMHPSLPGVFESNPITAMDGSLWTIKSELILYLITPLFVARTGRRVIPFLIAYCVSIAWVYWFSVFHITPLSRTLSLQFVGMASYYFLGAFIAINRLGEKTIFFALVLSSLLWFFTDGSAIRIIVEPFLITSAVLFCCLYIPNVGFTIGSVDISYGVYLYNFPVVQVLISLGLFRTHPYMALLVSVFVSCAIAYISWVFVEHQFLKKGRGQFGKRKILYVKAKN